LCSVSCFAAYHIYVPFRRAEEAGEANEKKLNAENVPAGEDAVDGNQEAQPDGAEEKEPEEKVNN